jgi:hypothetical protein
VAAFFLDCKSGLRRLYILSLPALGAFYYIELDLLAFLQAAESTGLDRREVNENVFAVLAADETIAFCIVKPLYCSCFHIRTCFLLLECCVEQSLEFCRQGHAVERSYREARNR